MARTKLRIPQGGRANRSWPARDQSGNTWPPRFDDAPGRRVRYRGLLRSHQATGWGGLWLRVDGASGPLLLDNMEDRPVRHTTGWTEASIVLDVPEEAESLHFGMLLSGDGALDLARPEFEEAAATVPVTVTARARTALPDEPQALDF
ncbi:MAG: hypothetical protein JO016_05580 [Actinobacteria bacterium]|nr:hypothetical protein [Actinomycetota bacterium]